VPEEDQDLDSVEQVVEHDLMEQDLVEQAGQRRAVQVVPAGWMGHPWNWWRGHGHWGVVPPLLTKLT
jgi:hypothetical protein